MKSLHLLVETHKYQYLILASLILAACYRYSVSRVSNSAGTPGYRNGTESFFGLKGRPSVVRDVEIHNQPVLRMRRK
jgi:hypothetical protein